MGSELGGHDVLQQCWNLLLFDGLLALHTEDYSTLGCILPKYDPHSDGAWGGLHNFDYDRLLACVGNVVTFVRCGPYHRPHIFFPLYTMAMLARMW